jgi:hypothetical protein
MAKEKAKAQKSGLAIASLVLGIVSFIPLVGVLLGILAIIFGIVSFSKIKKENLGGRGFAIAGIILGILGLLISVLVYGVLFFMLFNSDKMGGAFNEPRIELTKQIMIGDAGMLELYKKAKGSYPETLSQLEDFNYTYYPTDHFLTEFEYNVSSDGQSFTLKSAGPDKMFDTADDILFK